MSHNHEKDAWSALTAELGEALLDAERTFQNVVEQFETMRFQQEETLTAYMHAWSRLSRAHRSLASFLTH